MIFRNTFKEVSLIKDNLTLILKSNKQTIIPISELDKVYLTMDKIAPIYTISYVSISLLILFVLLWKLLNNPFMILTLITIIIIVGIKLINHKSYGLEICLKNGDYFKKRIPSESKYDTIDVINTIRKEIYTYAITNH
jgi:hypothetical protein